MWEVTGVPGWKSDSQGKDVNNSHKRWAPPEIEFFYYRRYDEMTFIEELMDCDFVFLYQILCLL